jgi:hypothetical protein
MKRANIGAVLNFDLCDFQKLGQIKNPGIMSCILIRCTYDKNLEMILPPFSSGVIALCWFSKMVAWRPYLKSDRAKIQQKCIWCLDTCSHKVRMFKVK